MEAMPTIKEATGIYISQATVLRAKKVVSFLLKKQGIANSFLKK
jgi:hypothetical protein